MTAATTPRPDGDDPTVGSDDRVRADREWSALRSDLVGVREELLRSDAITDSTSFRVGRLLVALVRRPRSIPTLVRAWRSTNAGATVRHLDRPARTGEPGHHDRDLLWAYRTVDPSRLVAVIGGAEFDEAGLPLRPHDALALVGNLGLDGVVVDAGAAAPGRPWYGLGTSSRSHLDGVVRDVVDMARRRSIPVIATRSGETSSPEWWERFTAENPSIDVLTGGDALSRALERISVDHDGSTPEPMTDVHSDDAPRAPVAAGSDATSVLVAGHDMKFVRGLAGRLRDQGWTVEFDPWASFGRTDQRSDEASVPDVDTVLCEFAGANAVWYSRHRPADQRLIVRLHRFELDTEIVREIDWGRVDRLVVVSDHHRSLAAQRFDIDTERIVVVPNAVDVADFDREKSDPLVRFHLGLIGAVPARKGLARALDVLRTVRERDDRFCLFVKSAMPWDLRWVWNSGEERSYFEAALERAQTDPVLAGAVTFDPSGDDVADWLRSIGAVLSTSDDESFHVAPIEGMASRAVPVVFDWPAARSVYDDRWIVSSVDAAADAIVGLADPATWEARRNLAVAEAQRYDVEAITERWAALLDPRQALD